MIRHLVSVTTLVLLVACGGGDDLAPPDQQVAASPARSTALQASTGALAGQDGRATAMSAPTTAAVAADSSTAPLTDEQALAYIASHADLIAAFGTDIAAGRNHYATYGRAEGRKITFDPLAYIASYPDLITVFQTDTETALRQYIRRGFSQGRKVTFDGLRYLASNPDVARSVGDDPSAGARHYVNFGYAEGRTSSFNALRYLASHFDLILAYGADLIKATKHYITWGYSEGRAITFNADQYLDNYADLRATYGANQDAATAHYINYGMREGRTDVRPNRAPVARISQLGVPVVSVGSSVNLNGGLSSDPDGDSLTYTWSLRGRPVSSSAQLAGASSPTAALAPDVPGIYLVELVVADGRISSPVASLEIRTGTSISGNLATSAVWTKQGSPYIIDHRVGVPAGLTLSITEGVEVIGSASILQVQGVLEISGTPSERVRMSGVTIQPSGTSSSNHMIRISHAEIIGQVYSNSGGTYGNLVLRDSRVEDSTIYLWYPTGTSIIERNFLSGVRISYGLNGSSIVIKNNSTDSEIENWAMYGGSSADVSLNTFRGSGVATKIPSGYSSAALNADNNYWGTTDTNAIRARIFDKEDDLTCAGYVSFMPFLTAPHPDTPPQ